MTNKLKNSILILLSTLLTFCVGFFAVTTFSAKADTVDGDNYTDYNLIDKNGIYQFMPDSTINPDFNENDMELGFEISILKPYYANLMKLQSDKIDNNLGGKQLMGDTFKFTFTLYRGNGDGVTSTALEKIHIDLCYTTSKGSLESPNLKKVVWREQLSYYDEATTLSGFDTYDYEYSESTLNSMIATYKSNGKELISAGILSSGGLFNPKNDETLGSIKIKVNSPSAKYFIRFSYTFSVCPDDRVLIKEDNYSRYTKTTGVADSNALSVKEFLEDALNDGTLENLFSSSEGVDYANAILNNTSTKTVKVQFLKDIANTPFAQKFETTVTVPVMDTTVYLDDVCAALNVDNLDAISGRSKAGWLEYNSADNVYVVHYLSSVWLRAFTSGDEYCDYFLDTNLSYKEFYQQFIDDNIITNDLFEYQYSGLLSAYPNLSGYLTNQIYGFFGVVMMPDSYDLNKAFQDIFGIKAQAAGILNQFEQRKNVSASTFYSLLDNYDYGWLKTLEASVNSAIIDGEFAARIYLFVCDGEDRTALIGAGGQDSSSDGSAIGEEIADKGGKLKDIGDSIFNLIHSAGSNKYVLIGVIIVALVIIFFWKIYPTISNRKRRK